MALSRLIDLFSFLGAAVDEFLIYSAKERNAIIEEIIITPEKTLAKHAITYTTIQIINKGRDGAGSDILASVTTNIADPDAIDFTASVAYFIPMNIEVTIGDNISLKKIDQNVPDLGFSNIVVSERRI
jgi:hypothetical protein